MKYEYNEGDKARKNFENSMKAIFKVRPKKTIENVSEKASETSEKKHESDKD